MLVRVHVFVTGRVQGVGFRAFACRKAAQHGLTGWVKNVPDGQVESEAQGVREDVDRFLTDLTQGPAFSSVDQVEVDWIEALDSEDAFHVVY